jgi:hypothetical protein
MDDTPNRPADTVVTNPGGRRVVQADVTTNRETTMFSRDLDFSSTAEWVVGALLVIVLVAAIFA